MTVIGKASREPDGSGAPGHGGHVYFPPQSGKPTFTTPGPGAYNSATVTSKFALVPGAAVDRSIDAGYKRAYWTKGLITKEGLVYLPHRDVDIHGPAQLNTSGQTMDGRAPAFAPLREPHLRPKETFGRERRFRLENKLGMIKSGIHDLVLPGPGTYIRPFEKSKRYTVPTMMAPADGEMHDSEKFSMAQTAFGSTATGIHPDPAQRSDTPRGRNSWIRGAIVHAKSCAPDVSLQNIVQTKGVLSDHLADISRTSSFLHSSFNVQSQHNARSPLRRKALESVSPGAIDSRGRPKMNRFAPQPPELTRTVNTMA